MGGTYDTRPLRIVRTYYPPSSGTGDSPHMVAEDGRHWRMATSYETSGQLTCPGTLRDVYRGFIW